MYFRDVRVFVKIVRSTHRRIGVQFEHLIIVLDDADEEADAIVKRIIDRTIQCGTIFLHQLTEYVQFAAIRID